MKFQQCFTRLDALSSLSCTNEYLTIDSGWSILVDILCAVIAAWLNALIPTEVQLVSLCTGLPGDKRKVFQAI